MRAHPLAWIVVSFLAACHGPALRGAERAGKAAAAPHIPLILADDKY